MDVRHATIQITTDSTAGFSRTISAPGPLFLHAVLEAGSNINANADLTITDANTTMPLLVSSNFGSTSIVTWTPRRLINNAADGVESTANVFDYQAITQRMTVSISSTADGETGTLHIVCG